MLKFAGMKRDRHANHAKLHVIAVIAVMVTLLLASASEAGAQSRDKQRRAQVDSMLTARYYQNGGIDTAYLQRHRQTLAEQVSGHVGGIQLHWHRQQGEPFRT